jgi:methionine-rich copper-binding protein CopC
MDMKTTILAVATSLAITMGAISTGALAHSKQETTVPMDGTTVMEVNELVLRFDQPMRVTRIALTGSDGEIGLSSEMGTDAVTEYVATPESHVAPGNYEVEWRGLAADGHPMQGGYSFTVDR